MDSWGRLGVDQVTHAKVTRPTLVDVLPGALGPDQSRLVGPDRDSARRCRNRRPLKRLTCSSCERHPSVPRPVGVQVERRLHQLDARWRKSHPGSRSTRTLAGACPC